MTNTELIVFVVLAIIFFVRSFKLYTVYKNIDAGKAAIFLKGAILMSLLARKRKKVEADDFLLLQQIFRRNLKQQLSSGIDKSTLEQTYNTLERKKIESYLREMKKFY